MRLSDADPHEMCDPLHRHPGLIAAMRQEEPDDWASEDARIEAALKRHLGPAWKVTLAA